ncbi:uncharacterized protein LOC107641765 isoform X4 [Arachis ipaensis]|uniref:uncharacterized protein LOC107641765 isoform X4 n=1 Tax=Arachis ipaensis TaxID=130454 RepID=UPI0007AFD462|nr:uncharacterized protein LOC107641765 isoform X4 [Arachis ipaensis]
MKMREREGSKAELVSVIASTAFTAAVTTIAQENPPQQGKERVSYSTDEQSLREVFGKYGDVVDDPEDLGLLLTVRLRRCEVPFKP